MALFGFHNYYIENRVLEFHTNGLILFRNLSDTSKYMYKQIYLSACVHSNKCKEAFIYVKLLLNKVHTHIVTEDDEFLIFVCHII